MPSSEGIVCNIVKTHLESKSQLANTLKGHRLDCVQYSKNTFRKQITTGQSIESAFG